MKRSETKENTSSRLYALRYTSELHNSTLTIGSVMNLFQPMERNKRQKQRKISITIDLFVNYKIYICPSLFLSLSLSDFRFECIAFVLTIRGGLFRRRGVRTLNGIHFFSVSQFTAQIREEKCRATAKHTHTYLPHVDTLDRQTITGWVIKMPHATSKIVHTADAK